MVKGHSSSPTAEHIVAERTDPEAYKKFLLTANHGDELEAVISVAARTWSKRHEIATEILQQCRTKQAHPAIGDLLRSPRYRAKDAAFMALVEGLAAGLNARYPSPDGEPPITTAAELVEARVGKRCTGWAAGPEKVKHHNGSACPVHTQEEHQ